MPPIGGASKNYNIGAQPHSFIKSYMLYTGFCAYKLTNFNPFLALQAQIWYGDGSVCKKLSEN